MLNIGSIKSNKCSTAKAIERDAKYLKFLMNLYLKINAGYTQISIVNLCTESKVDTVATQAVVELGWVNKLGALRHASYYWKAAPPTIEQAQEIQKKIAAIKAVRDVNAKSTETPKNKNGKALVPLIKKTNLNPIKKSGATLRYLQFLEALYLKCADRPTSVSMNEMLREHKISKAVPSVLIKLGMLTKGDGKRFHWIGNMPTPSMAENVKAGVNHNINQNAAVKNKSKEVKGWIPPQHAHLVETKPEMHTKLVVRTKADPKTEPIDWLLEKTANMEVKPSNKDLKKSIALKLIALGELEHADKLLGELL